MSIPPLTHETAPQYLHLVDHLRRAADWVERAVQRLALAGPVEMPDGYLYGPHPHIRRPIDAEAAMPVLEARLGDLAPMAVSRRVTKTGIRAALSAMKKQDSSVKVGAWLSKTLEELEAAGAVATKVTHPVGFYRPGKDDEDQD
jgi:hypothetical protein